MRPVLRGWSFGVPGSVAAVALSAALLGGGCAASTGTTPQPPDGAGSLLPPLQETPATTTGSPPIAPPTISGASGSPAGISGAAGSGATGSGATGSAATTSGATGSSATIFDATGSPGASASATVDPSLLDVIPSEIDGNQVTESAEAEESTASDPAFARSVARLAVAFVADAPGMNWAVTTVSALRPGLWGDAFFRGWRDSYDAGACAQSGGVSGHAEAEIGGRQVWIGTCSNGVRTYHVHVDQGDLLVSISALGDARFGEQLLAALDVGGGPASTP